MYPPRMTGSILLLIWHARILLLICRGSVYRPSPVSSSSPSTPVYNMNVSSSSYDMEACTGHRQSPRALPLSTYLFLSLSLSISLSLSLSFFPLSLSFFLSLSLSLSISLSVSLEREKERDRERERRVCISRKSAASSSSDGWQPRTSARTCKSARQRSSIDIQFLHSANKSLSHVHVHLLLLLI